MPDLTKTVAAVVAALLLLCVSLPIWLYLVFWVLRASGAGDLQIFLFCVYAVATAVGTAIPAIARKG